LHAVKNNFITTVGDMLDVITWKVMEKWKNSVASSQ
jgi:hypothetical protein